ncbi:MAG: hypothetical protein MJZ76_00260 [Bacteroidales bacterium]|nr:hypothetical protein [Bacteroidales bacterium]
MYPLEKKPYALYIHGVGSGGHSSTKSSLCSHLTDYEWIAPDITLNPYESISLLNEWAKTFQPTLIAGTSMGGFYTLYVDAPTAIKVAVNPGFYMETALRKLGYGKYKYLCERENGETEYVIDEPTARRFIQFRQDTQVKLGIKNLALFSSNDELIGKENAKKNAAAIENCGFDLLWSDKFGHRLNDRAMKKIEEWLK